MAQNQPPKGDPNATVQQYDTVGNAPQLQSGEMLLVEAYAAFWLVVLVFVGLMYLRTRKMEAQLATLVTALAKARERDDAKRAKGATPPAEDA